MRSLQQLGSPYYGFDTVICNINISIKYMRFAKLEIKFIHIKCDYSSSFGFSWAGLYLLIKSSSIFCPTLSHKIKESYHHSALCLSNRIKMSKSDIYMSSFHIYVQIVIYMSKLQYIYPNCNICIQTVIYIYPKYKCCACPLSVLYITSYTSSHICEQFDVCMSRSFSTYIFFALSTACKCS